jgi:phage-related baseplate assembly protein
VSSPAPGYVEIAVLSQLGDGSPSDAMLAAVNAAVNNSSVRVVTDFLTVVPAAIITVPVAATVYLLPEAPYSVFEALEASLTAAFAAEASLGWDVTLSWLIAQLQADGVQRVELAAPTATVVCDSRTAPALGIVTLTYGGRDR